MIYEQKFGYVAVCLFPRKRNPVRIFVADTHPVAIPEIPSEEAPAVCVIKGLGETLDYKIRESKDVEYRVNDGRFYRRHSATYQGDLLAAADIHLARNTTTFRIGEDYTHDQVMTAAQFATADVRVSVTSRDRAISEMHASFMDGGNPKIIVVDGASYELCREPVLKVEPASWQSRIKVVDAPSLEAVPNLQAAHDLSGLFRLDRLDDAIAWAETRYPSAVEADCLATLRNQIVSLSRADLLAFDDESVALVDAAKRLFHALNTDRLLLDGSPELLAAFARLRDTLRSDPLRDSFELSRLLGEVVQISASEDYSSSIHEDHAAKAVERWNHASGMQDADALDAAALAR